MKIILIGFMGSGKTTVSKLLGERLGIEVFEMDALVLERSGRSSINEIFERDGEEHFRRIETQVAETLSTMSDAIVSSGGGIVTNERNVSCFRESGGTVVYLRATFDAVRERLGSANDRPLFRDLDRARRLHEEREGKYLASCDIIVDTDRLTPDEICEQVLYRLNERKPSNHHGNRSRGGKKRCET